MRAGWLVVLAAACGGATEAGYEGTVVVGAGYVQALVTAPGDEGCPPRVQRAGVCVRTPTEPGTCADAPACVTGLTVTDGAGTVLGASASGFVEVPSALPERVTIEVRGCGGTWSTTVELGEPMAPFADATATLEPQSIELTWSPSGAADLVCALATGPGYREVCCDLDTGAMSMARAPATDVDAVYLSRGRSLGRAGSVDLYRTVETGSLLPP